MSDAGALRERVAALAEALEGIHVDRAAGLETWSVAGRPFAVVAGSAIELRMDPAVAHAATRTPDTTTSHRGPEWIRFEPPVLDDHAADRLDAWFAHACRRARD
ncbi:MAG TPA: hypothetical protein VNH13_10360 [Candidatus Acidoferrales bacterium]|nr:hypothetical protein [Candidatus Acidoferrales bacterium]